MADILFELRLFGISLLTGAALMILYDGLRIFRLFIRHGTVWTGIEDMIYWVCAAAAVSVVFYRENDGNLRGCCIAGVIGGMMLYNRTCSRFLLKVLKKAKKCIKMKLYHNVNGGQKR